MSASAAVLRALQALPRGSGPAALGALAPLFEEALADAESARAQLHEELVRVLGAVMAEHTPATLEEAAALATGVAPERLREELPRLRAALDGLRAAGGRVEALVQAEAVLATTGAARHTHAQLARAVRETREQLARELSREYAPVAIGPDEALAVALWSEGRGAAPRGAALLELARGLDSLCRQGPLSGPALEALRAQALRADLDRAHPGWRALFERVRAVRPRLVAQPRRSPLEASLKSTGAARTAAPHSLVGLLEVEEPS